jgi:PadR family transcriptional regulator AphA
VSLKHVILVVLKDQPASGYELNQVFAGELGLFWNTSHQAVYRALASMDKEDLVGFVAHEQSGKPDKKTYQITSQGEQVLQQWLSEVQPPMQINEDIMVKFFAGNLIANDTLLKQVQVHYLVHKQKLQGYQITEKYILDNEELNAQQKVQFMTLRRGILMEQARLDWCVEAIAALSQFSLSYQTTS